MGLTPALSAVADAMIAADARKRLASLGFSP
jgi:hypothetical protein